MAVTRDDTRRSLRDLYRALAKAREARGDVAGARMARWQAKQMGEGIRQLGALAHGHRSSETGRWRRRA